MKDGTMSVPARQGKDPEQLAAAGRLCGSKRPDREKAHV